jgi:hypothetical protein
MASASNPQSSNALAVQRLSAPLSPIARMSNDIAPMPKAAADAKRSAEFMAPLASRANRKMASPHPTHASIHSTTSPPSVSNR